MSFTAARICSHRSYLGAAGEWMTFENRNRKVENKIKATWPAFFYSDLRANVPVLLRSIPNCWLLADWFWTALSSRNNLSARFRILQCRSVSSRRCAALAHSPDFVSDPAGQICHPSAFEEPLVRSDRLVGKPIGLLGCERSRSLPVERPIHRWKPGSKNSAGTNQDYCSPSQLLSHQVSFP